MGERVNGRNAVVTGGGRGIGREIALALANEGARVVVNDLGAAVDGAGSSHTPADEVVAEIRKRGGEAVASYDSVADFQASQRIIQICLDSFGRIDILVNVAGILRDRMSFNMTKEEWDDVIKVHLYGAFYTCRHAIPLMRQQKYGRIINTVSVAWKGTVGHVNYGAAKGGIVSLTRSLARELGKYGITCNAIAPEAATRMTLSHEVKEGFKKRRDAGLLTQEMYDELLALPGPEFVSPIVVYLASDYAANINGAIFSCGGGKIALYSEPVECRVICKDYKKLGAWTFDELIDLLPKNLLADYINPAPLEEEKRGG